MSELTGKKFDSEKVDMDLLSPYAMEKIAQVMTYGKQKYGRDNWRGGIVFSRLLAAVMRHINAYRKGETFDPETGLSHLSHASCGLMMLLEFEETHPELDDRFLKKSEEKKLPDYIVMPPGATGGGIDKYGTFFTYPDAAKVYTKNLVVKDNEKTFG